ncbi:MAG TPA: dihydroorotate dehydrogenase [Candidatus Baltobacteraceae bacterium]|nr:dihydroorotate dehydrogenase [Candidatus Baltobacteraceae bacterium]
MVGRVALAIVTTPDLSVTLGGLELSLPTLMGSGCYGSGAEYAPFIDLAQIGGVVLKSVTRFPRLGNDPPRLAATPSGMLNAIGLQNPGIAAYLAHDVADFASRPCAVIGSVAGFSVKDYAYVTERLAARDEIDAIELNISCPNVGTEGETFACDPDLAERATRAARGVTGKTLIVKLSPNVTDIAAIARVVEAAGADALAVINTVRGMSIDVERREPRLGNAAGGLSGPAIRPIAVLAVWEVARAVRIPIVGQGGIETARDALEFILAGASAVSIGTGNFTDPRAPLTVVEGLRTYLSEKKLASLSELVGRANPGFAGGKR